MKRLCAFSMLCAAAVLAHATTPGADRVFAANDTPAPAVWKKLTEENLPFTVAGGQKARFGAGTKWIERFLQAGTYVCAQPATFRPDPPITTGHDNGVLSKECLGPYFVDK